MPEVWCRMSRQERQPKFLIENGYLEKCEDFEFNGQKVLASRLGYRITPVCPRLFRTRLQPSACRCSPKRCSSPEMQDSAVFADGVDNIVGTQNESRKLYSTTAASPRPVRRCSALLHIMKDQKWDGKELPDPEFRNSFMRESLLQSDWYATRLAAKQKVERQLWRKHSDYLGRFLRRQSHAQVATELGIGKKLEQAGQMLREVESADYLQKLRGTIGVVPMPQR